MILIACVDDGLGMAFNRRRQSRDRVLCARVLERAGGKPLWMSAYSAGLFSGGGGNIRVDEDFFALAADGEYCFTELAAPAPWAERVEQVILYRWNRIYPADLRFDLPLEGFSLRSEIDFSGFSHERITEEIYTK